jgi:hypothetical protein
MHTVLSTITSNIQFPACVPLYVQGQIPPFTTEETLRNVFNPYGLQQYIYYLSIYYTQHIYT